MEKKTKNKILCILFAIIFVIFFIGKIFIPEDDFSESERRKLHKMPEFTIESIKSGTFMKNFNLYTMDRFPYRDDFRRIKAKTSRNVFFKKDEHNLYIKDGHIGKIDYPYNKKSIENAIQCFSQINEKYLSESNDVYFSLIPDKNSFIGELSIDFDIFEKDIKENIPFAEYIPIADLLEIDDYYRTDPHWKQENITDIANRINYVMNTESIGQYDKKSTHIPFYGAYAGQLPLYVEPDKISYLWNKEMNYYKVKDLQNGRKIPVYDLKKISGRDPYEVFLSGPLSLVTIENPVCKNNRKLVLFRDSFGSALAPLLARGYSEITLVDIRYISPMYLENFIDFTDKDVLFLYSTTVLNHSETLKR